MPRLRRILFNTITVLSLLLCIASAIAWPLTNTPGDHGFDLVRWDGDEHNFLDRGLACRPRYGFLELTSLRVRGGIAPGNPIDESDPSFPPQSANDDLMPGVADSRGGNAGPPHRWNITNHVWDFNIRETDYLDTGPPLIDTPWGLQASVQKAAFDIPLPDGVTWNRITRRNLRVPFWNLIVLFAIPPLARVTQLLHRAHRRRRQHRQPNRCAVCNYDLRATPARCPECGVLAKRHRPV